MKTDGYFSEQEFKLLNSALDEISNEITRVTHVPVTRRENLVRRFYFGKDQIFRDVRLGYNINREGIMEFGIVAKLSRPCDKPDSFVDGLKDIFDEDDNFECQSPDIVKVTYKCCLNIDDCDFNRALDCIKERILKRFIQTYDLVQNIQEG
jgi:hypothetical protein